MISYRQFRLFSGYIIPLFLLLVLQLMSGSVTAQPICEPQCSGQCPNPNQAKYNSVSGQLRNWHVSIDTKTGLLFDYVDYNPVGDCSSLTFYARPKNVTEWCSPDYFNNVWGPVPYPGQCPVSSGARCFDGSLGTMPAGCAPTPTPPGPPTSGPPSTGGGTAPVPGITYGAEPVAGGVPTTDANKDALRYCAYMGEDGQPLCICGSQTDETLSSDGTIDLLASCTETKYCIEHPGKCTRVTAEQCTGKKPLGQEGIVVNQKSEDIGGLITIIFTFSLGILGLSLFIMILYAGFEWLTAAGDPGRIGKAKGRIYNAVMGTILLLSSYIILELINPNLVSNTVNLPIQGTQAPPRPPATIDHADCLI